MTSTTIVILRVELTARAFQDYFLQNVKFRFDFIKSDGDTIAGGDDVPEHCPYIFQQPHLPPHPVEVPGQHSGQGGHRSTEHHRPVQEAREDRVSKNSQGINIKILFKSPSKNSFQNSIFLFG